MTVAIKVKAADVKVLVKATFPTYNGRKFKVVPTTEVTLHDLNWSGGTRSQYRACTFDGTLLGTADKYNAMWPADNIAEGARLPILPGAVLVRHCFFCGSDLGITIYVHPSDMPRYITK